MPNKNLFKEFNTVSEKEWKQQIQVDLKGADYNDTLIWESLEGIHVKPFYHHDNFEYLAIPTPDSDYQVCQSVFIADAEIANKIAIEALQKGATAIQFIANETFDIDVLLNGFKELKNSPKLYFKNNFLAPNFNKQLLDFFEGNTVIIQQDSIGNFALTGNWFSDKEKDLKANVNLLQENSNSLVLGVDAGIYQNAGANIVQQVAYALSHANEYIEYFGKQAIDAIQFEFSTGSNYFFEIAKLRAFRYLWMELTKQHKNTSVANILSKPSMRNKTLYDYNVNLLRTTSENMSAILGGSDTLTTLAYDELFKKSNEFSQRIARNQLLLLKEENGFINAKTFAKGSYYIEALTIEIAKKALEMFQDVEKSGGFLSLLKKGIIQGKINDAAQKEQELFDAGKLTLLGTNKYPNEADKMKDNLELYPFVKKDKRQTEIQPIIPKRLAEKMEQERIDSE